jgi:putative flippase GtrA
VDGGAVDRYEVSRVTAAPLGPLTGIADRLGLPPAFFKFVFVGALAFVVNQVALYVFYDSPLAAVLPGKDAEIEFGLFAHPDARLLIASVLAVEVAIVFKFVWSEGWIFRDRRPDGGVASRFVHFNISCATSSVLTITITNILTPVFGISPYISTAIAVLAGFMLNWVWSARLVWPEKPAAAATD